jgi:hypothetical protein
MALAISKPNHHTSIATNNFSADYRCEPVRIAWMHSTGNCAFF